MSCVQRTLIDGYNVIRTNPSGSRIEQSRGGEAARQWLIELCCSAIRPGEQWTVVFDGAGIGSSHDAGGATITVRFAAPQTADDLIREMAFHARSISVNCQIVSSDNDVRIAGCAFQDSGGFYDYLLRHAGRESEQPADDAGRTVEKLLAYLVECGNIESGVFIAAATRAALRELVMYFAPETCKPQKIARSVEGVLRDGMHLMPNPDREKIIFRNIKKFFEKNTG